jgi:hypothetical protein
MSKARTVVMIGASGAVAAALMATSFAVAAPGRPGAAHRSSATPTPGVVRLFNINLEGAPVHTGTHPAFVGKPVTVKFANKKTSALVTATLDYYSKNGGSIDADLAACYAKGSAAPKALTRVEPNFTAPAGSYFAQTVSGAVGNLAAGTYRVGVCTWFESGNAGHGHGTATVEVVQAQAAVLSQ